MIKFLCEVIPLLIFFISYKYYDLKFATLVMIITTYISLAVNYYIDRKFSKMSLVTTAILTIFGMLTIFTGNPSFIKMKPTIIYLVFSSILLISAYYKKGLLKHVLGMNFDFDDNIWIKLSIRWGLFFLFLALLNELVWRNFSEVVWIKFKVFGFLPITIIFLISQLPYMNRLNKKDTNI